MTRTGMFPMTADRQRRIRQILLAALVFLTLAFPAGAHFLLNLNVRIFHVEHLSDGVRVWARMPMPYLVAGLTGPVGADGLPQAAPFTFNRLEDGNPAHYVDRDALGADALGLGRLAADGLHLAVRGDRLQPSVESVRLHRVGNQPPFATLDEARVAFAGSTPLSDTDPLYVGDAVVDVILRYAPGQAISTYELSSTLDPGLPGQDKTANLILDYAPGGTKAFRASGLLADPVIVSRSSFAAILTFVKEGVIHILEGLDHVLFVLCLVIGAPSLKSLALRVTGFTVGHSVTLTAGFFGFVPAGAWFVPAVETGIALSIIYAAVVAVRVSPDRQPAERSMVLVTTSMGLLHGLGFSFVLKNILQVTSPDIWQSLLAFNVGVEVGQLFIVLLVWPVFKILQKTVPAGWSAARIGTAAVCSVIAAYWTVERTMGLIAVL